MSSKKIGHHYISEGYLRNFTNKKNRVCVLTPENRIFETSPNNICKENHYNTVNGSLIIENSLAEIEGEVFKIINNKIKGQIQLSKSDKDLLAYYVSLIFCRVKNRREGLRKSLNELVRWAENFKEKDDILNKAALPASGKSISISELKKGLGNFNQKFAVSSMSNAAHSTNYIVNMKWAFWTAPGGTFITSDDPVSLCRPEAELKYGPRAMGSRAGLAHEDVELTFPITSEVLLLAGWRIERDLLYLPVPNNMINGLNYRTTRTANSLFATNRRVLNYILKKDEEYKQKTKNGKI